MSIQLLENEVILKKTYPHFFSMISLYFTWFYIGLVGFTFWTQQDFIQKWIESFFQSPEEISVQQNKEDEQLIEEFFTPDFLKNFDNKKNDSLFQNQNKKPVENSKKISKKDSKSKFSKESIEEMFSTMWKKCKEYITSIKLPKQIAPFGIMILWSLCLLIPAVFLAFYRVHISWFFFALFLIAGGFASVYYYKNLSMANIWLLGISIVGIIGANIYRCSHKYIITNKRIVTRFGGISTKERDLIYSKIDDMIIHRDLLGRIFNFGTIIPISASGMGTGTDQVFMLASTQHKLPVGPTLQISLGGGRSVTVPRAPSFYSLYGVSDPETLKNMILVEMGKREYMSPTENKAGKNL